MNSIRFLLLILAQLILVENSWIIDPIKPRRNYHAKPHAAYQRSAWKPQETVRYAGNFRNNAEVYQYKKDVQNDRVQNDFPNVAYEVRTTKQRSTQRDSNPATKDDVKSSVDSPTCEKITQFAPNSGIPCNLDKPQTPMFVYFSFDDAITTWNIQFYRRLFGDSGRTNPNGCPIRATFFNSHDNTEYDLLKELYNLGHEIGSHSISHKGPSNWWSQNATKDDWVEEIVGQRENIHKETGKLRGNSIPLKAIKGMRAPFLALGGDLQYEMLEENDFVYDASIPNNNQEPSWPFTLHDPTNMNGPICRSQYCPKNPHNIWEVVMNVYYMEADQSTGTQRPCSMIDGCRPSGNKAGALKFLKTNFQRHYDSIDKVPFGINMHAAWFAFEGYVDAMAEFMDYLLDQDDVFIVPVHKLLDWIKQPKTVQQLASSSWGCEKQ